jgi:hypothetical protein
MSKIDLSKAKIGDKFRTEFGYVLELVGLCRRKKYKYILERVDDKYISRCYDVSGYTDSAYKDEYRLVEQVLDKPLDELIEEGTKQLRESRDAIAEENELQRRQEVIELAERLLFMNRMHDAYEAYIEALNKENLQTLMSFPLYILQCAEDFIKHKNQYLKEGKL